MAEEKTLRRKCFLQLLGVSFPTLRPTTRQIAAKSRDSSAAEMPFCLIPLLSKHSSHTRLPQRAVTLHLCLGDWLVISLVITKLYMACIKTTILDMAQTAF